MLERLHPSAGFAFIRQASAQEPATPELPSGLRDELPGPLARDFFQHVQSKSDAESLAESVKLAERLARTVPQAPLKQLTEAFDHLNGGLSEQLPGKLAESGREFYLQNLASGASPQSALQTTLNWSPVLGAAVTPEQQKQLPQVMEIARGLSDRPQDWPLLGKQLLGLEDLNGLSSMLTEVEKAPWQAEGSWALADGCWQDSPDGSYGSNQNIALTTPPIDLTTLDSPRLSLAFEHDLADDQARLEVSQDGQDWTRLARFTGQWKNAYCEWDLEPYRGRNVSFRLRLISDSSTQGDGLKIRSLRVRGRQADGAEKGQLRVPLWFEGGSQGPQAFLDTYRACNPTEQKRMLEGVKTLRDEVGELGAALELLPLVPATLDQKEYLESCLKLGRLARETDLNTAASVFGEQGQPQQAASLFHCVRALSHWSDEATQRDYFKKLTAAQLQPQEVELLEQLVLEWEGRPQPWLERGGWGQNIDPDGSLVWQDSPLGSYHGNADNSLTTGWLDLGGLQQPVLRYQLKSGLETNDDYLRIEASRDGREWKSLKTHTGNSEWNRHELALDDFEGRLRLRFRLTSDSSSNYDGVSLRHLSLEHQGQQALPLRVDDGDRPPSTLLEMLCQRPAEQRMNLLTSLQSLTQSGNSLPAALTLYQELEHLGLGQGEKATARLGAVGALAQRVGVGAAVRLWPPLAHDPEPEQAAERAERAYRLAQRAQLPAGAPENLAAKLLAAAAESEDIAKLERLSDFSLPDLDGWSRSGDWGFELDPQKGTVLADSPHSSYRPKSQSYLTSPVLDLSGARRPLLSFERDFKLEHNDDFVHVELRTIPGDWQRLVSYTGEAGWGEEQLNLERFGGRSVQLRFAMTSDSSSEYQGFRLAQLRLSDLDEGLQAKNLLSLRTGAPDYAAVVDLYCDTPSSQRQALLDRMLEVAEATGDLRAAYLLPDSKAAPLVPRFGLEAARQVEASEVDPDFAALGQRFHQLLGGPDEVPYWLETGRLLQSLELPAESLEQLLLKSERSEAQRPASLPSSWGQEHHHEQGLVWSDSPGGSYSANARNNLELGTFNLWQKEKPTLEITLRTELEDKDDYLFVEARPSGEDWQRLQSFTGTSDWRSHSLDLGPVAGKNFELRLRLHSDGATEKDGVQVSRIRLDAQGLHGPENLLNFEPGNPRVGQLLTALKGEDGIGDGQTNLELLSQMVGHFGGLRPALTVWPLVEQALTGPARDRDMQLVSDLVAQLGPGLATRLAPAGLGLEKPPADLAKRLSQLSVARQLKDPETVSWLAGRAVQDVDGGELAQALALLGDEAATVLTSFKENAGALLQHRTLAAVTKHFASQLSLADKPLEERLQAYLEQAQAPDFELQEGLISVGDQSVTRN